MTADDVVEVLELLDSAGVTVWLDGGWGVDALLGRETRRHADLDIAIDRDQLASAQRALAEAGQSTCGPPASSPAVRCAASARSFSCASGAATS